MAKSKQSGSAAARRAQEREQRQRRDDVRTVERNNNRGSKKHSGRRRQDRSQLYMVVGVVALLVVIIVGFVIISRLPASQTNTNPLTKGTSANAAILGQVTGVNQATWEAIADGGVKNPFTNLKGQPALVGPNGHPELFYVGGEFCPYCAAERWAVINALSRFGSFSNLSQLQSYESNISTYSFYKSTYTSQYVDFVPVETEGNQLDASGQSYVQLQKMTKEQEQTFTKYNSAQSFPFIDIGNQYTAIGASYAPTILLDSSQNSLDWQTIANALSDTKSPIARGILGTANYITAAICIQTNQQPGSVCNSAAIQKLQQPLKPTSNTASSHPLALSPADFVMIQRRILG
ncbi:MAG TPA: DUF929 family protein [Ktedonobacteraceae bacterium]|nr:DUF929 family protein [Ktedonobacteraceae bacterium]